MKIKHTVILDVYKIDHSAAIKVKQNNVNANVIEAILNNDSDPIDLTGCTVWLFAADSKTQSTLSMDVVCSERGICRCTLSPWFTNTARTIKCEVRVYKDEVVIGSSAFVIQVSNSIANEEAIEQTDDFSALNQALLKVNEIINGGFEAGGDLGEPAEAVGGSEGGSGKPAEIVDSRDFTEQPLDLETEVVGRLPMTNQEKQTASETPFSDSDAVLKSENVQDAIKEVFLFANSFKVGVVQAIGEPLRIDDTSAAITDKIAELKSALVNNINSFGVNVVETDSLQNIIEKVTEIQAAVTVQPVQTDIKRTTRLNVNAGDTHSIALADNFTEEDVVITVLKLVGNDSNTIHYQSDFNNSDESNFVFDENAVEFDGVMRVKDTFGYSLTPQTDYFESETVNLNDYIEFSDWIQVDLENLSMQLNGLKFTQAVVKARGDINLSGVATLDGVEVAATTTGNGDLKIAVSVDGGQTYHSCIDGVWMDLDITNMDSFKTSGMTAAQLNGLIDWEDLRNGSSTLRFAYYLERPSMADRSETDLIKLIVTMNGYDVLAETSDYSLHYDGTAQTIGVTFNAEGTYTIKYLDGRAD